MPLEKKLKALFERQKFEKNSDLQAVIDAVHARYRVRQLTEEESSLVTAAGTPGAEHEQNKKPWDVKHDVT